MSLCFVGHSCRPPIPHYIKASQSTTTLKHILQRNLAQGPVIIWLPGQPFCGVATAMGWGLVLVQAPGNTGPLVSKHTMKARPLETCSRLFTRQETCSLWLVNIWIYYTWLDSCVLSLFTEPTQRTSVTQHMHLAFRAPMSTTCIVA